MGNIVYADHAATTKLDENAFEVMKPWLLEEYGNPSQPYSFARKPRKAITEARATIAKCIGALPEEIYFTSGGTESNNWAIKGSVSIGNQDKIITSQFEHHSILRACERIESYGIPVEYICPSEEGFVLPEYLKHDIFDKSRLVSIMMVNNEIGTIQPIKQLCEIAHEYGALFHTDAVQAVGHIPIDVKNLGIDMLSASAHKFNGPKGVGFLYIRNGTKIAPYIDGGSQESGMRAGTEDVALIVGMAAALEKNTKNMIESQNHLRELEKLIIGGLQAAGIDFIRNGAEPHNPGNISLSFAGADGEMLLHRLDLMGIMVSTGSACDSKNIQISHVLKAIKTDEAYALGTIRISLGKENTKEEAYQIVDALTKILKK